MINTNEEDLGIKLQPLDDRVLVTQDEAEDVTAGGIIIPDTAKEKPRTGKVRAIGEEMVGVVGLGDTVLFGRYAGDEVEYEGVKYNLLSRADILAVVRE